MSTIAGVFSETTLRDIRVLAERIMLDDRIKQQFIPHLDIYNAIQAVQTANVTPLFRSQTGLEGGTMPVKEYDVEVMWRNVCGQTVENNTTCVLGGDKVSTNKQTYSLTWERIVQFSEDEADYRDNEFDLQVSIAKQLLMADKNLLEAFAAYMVAQLNTFKGVNQLGTSGKGVVTGTDTYIDPAYWDGTLVAYFLRAALINQFTTPALLSGQNLFEQQIIAAYNAANANGKGENSMYNGMGRMFWDLWNIDAVNTPDLITYMLSQGSVALGTKYYNPTTPQRTWEFWRYTMPSRFVPGITYDVFTNDECTTHDLIKYNYKVKMKADLFLNPEGCTANNTGVLTFICGTTQ